MIAGLLCLLLAGSLALRNLADGFLMTVLALGLFVLALRPATAYPVRVGLGEAVPGQSGAQFPLRITNPFTTRRRPCLTLTPGAVIVDLGSPLVIPWTQITEVRATAVVTGIPHPLLPPPRQNWLTIGVANRSAVPGAAPRLVRHFGGNTVAGIPATRLLSDPVVLFHTLHYYLDNPEARPELAGPAAIRRIRTARVEPHDV